MLRWYTDWAFRGVNRWKKEERHSRDIDLGKFGSVGAQVYGLSRGIAWNESEKRCLDLECNGFSVM